MIIRNGLLGDTVFVTPVIEKLKREYPNSRIDFAGSAPGREVAANIPGLSNYYIVPRFEILNHIRFFFSLRKNRYHAIFVQEMNTHYSIMARVTGARLVIGYTHSMQWLHNYSCERKGHAVEAEQILVNFITGCVDVLPSKIVFTDDEEESADSLLAELNLKHKSFAVIQSSCSESESIRQISDEKLALTADRLSGELGLSVVFPGTEKEKSKIEQIRALMTGESISLAGKTNIRQLAGLLKRASVVIGPDTGTLHAAVAAGTPVIMYMGWAVPGDTGPYDPTGRSKVIQPQLECVPCRYTAAPHPNWEYCKSNRPTLCMDKVEVSQIINHVEEILNWEQRLIE